MKKAALLTAAVLLALWSAGCVTATLQVHPAAPGMVAKSGAPVSHVVQGMNSGVYLFYYIPLWSGNPTNPNQRTYDLFVHRVDDKAIYRMFDVSAKRMRASRVEDVSIAQRSSGVWTLWIFWKRSVHGKAVLIREKRGRGKKRH